MSKKRLHTKRTALHFVIRNEQRFALLLGAKNAFRIFMVLSETKGALVIKFLNFIAYLHSEILLFLSICFFGRLDSFFSGDITKISGDITQVSGDMTSGDLTVSRLKLVQLILQLCFVKTAKQRKSTSPWFLKFHIPD